MAQFTPGTTNEGLRLLMPVPVDIVIRSTAWQSFIHATLISFCLMILPEDIFQMAESGNLETSTGASILLIVASIANEICRSLTLPLLGITIGSLFALQFQQCPIPIQVASRFTSIGTFIACIILLFMVFVYLLAFCMIRPVICVPFSGIGLAVFAWGIPYYIRGVVNFGKRLEAGDGILGSFISGAALISYLIVFLYPALKGS